MATEPLRLATIPGMQVFEPCNVDDTAYTAADLKAMAANWKAFRDRMEPPVVVGHEERQPLVEVLTNTGIPAVGWVDRVEFAEAPDRNGRTRPVLLTDAKEVHPALADAVTNKRYKKVSIEPWKRPPEQVFDGRDHILAVLRERGLDADAALKDAERWAPKELARLDQQKAAGKLARTPSLDWLVNYRLRDKLGPMLRRVAVLGGEVSRLGTLTDIPAPQFSDRRRDGLSTDEQWERFMATDTADAPTSADAKRAALEDYLRAAGWSDALIAALEAVPSSKFQNVVLAALADAAGISAPTDAAAGGDAVAAEESSETPEAADAEAAGTPDAETMIADLVALGYDEAELRAMSPGDLMATWQQEKGAAMSGAKPAAPVKPARKPTPAPDAAFAAARLLEEVRKERAAFQTDAATARRDRKAEQEATRKRRIKDTLEAATAGNQPKILPRDVDRFRATLEAADMDTVRKFGDKECSEFENLIDLINALPPNRIFGAEKVPQGGKYADVDAEVKRYVERRHPKRTA